MQKLLFWGPVLTASGYGEHARQLLRAILMFGPQFDVSVCGVKWGATPFLTDSEEFTQKIRALQEKYEEEKAAGVKYDISIQVTIPNEFQKLARVNIGVTAGIEVDRVSPEWIARANETVDLVVVPSKHSAVTFGQVSYKNAEGQELKLQKPMLVVPEGFDSKYFNLNRDPSDGIGLDLEADFNFLTVGLGLDKGIGEDRKNFSTLVKWFCETFAGDKRVGLVMKIGLVNNSLMDFETCKLKIQQLRQMSGCGEFPRIKLVHGRLTKEKLASLYKHPKIKAFVSLTHGEGYGLPMIEAAACGLPVLATNWSGHLDFLSLPDGKKRFVPLECDLVEIPNSCVWDKVMERGTRWANVKEDDTKTKMKKVMLSPEKPTEWAQELAQYLGKDFDEVKIGAQFVQALSQFLQQTGGDQTALAEQMGPKEVKKRMHEQLKVPEGKKTLLYTMPMSAGDVFISTAVIDSLKKKYPDHLIYFGTDSKYAAILKENPNIEKVLQFDQWMMNVPFCEGVFDLVFTPNLAVQLNTSNWVRGGKGRLLGEELAAQCDVPFGEYFIKTEPEFTPTPTAKYVIFHPGSGKGQHEARNYRHWKKVIHNLRKMMPDYSIVTVGQEGDIHFEGCVDLRGKTTYNQLAMVIQNAHCVVGIDSVSMHMAAAFGVDHVAIFGSSYSTSTGPVIKKKNVDSVLIDTPNRMGCEKACYKYTCVVDRESPCLNEIDPRVIVKAVLDMELTEGDVTLQMQNFEDISPKIAGYTHIFNPDAHGFPFIESIKSMLGFCDEVVVVDGGSTDGSLKRIEVEINDPRVKIHERKWDWGEPGMDGMQKAYGRAMVSVGPDDFLWQQDADEVVHEDDYVKIRKMAERFPSDVDLVHLPVVELWGGGERVRTDRHPWKWRMSKNNFRVTHGINKAARVLDEKTGKTYAKKNMSDGCEYVDIMTGEHLPHKGFYTAELDQVRQRSPESYGRTMTKIFNDLPVVFHYSWANLPRKIRNFKEFWNKCWSNLYNEAAPVDRFPDVHSDADVVQKAKELLIRGGEHGEAKTFALERSNPALMKDWLGRIGNDHGHLRDDQGQATPPQGDVTVTPEVDTQGAVQADAG